MAQLRFFARKNPNKMGENFYRRGDGTFAYFFEKGSSLASFNSRTIQRHPTVKGNVFFDHCFAILMIFSSHHVEATRAVMESVGFQTRDLEYDTRILQNRKRKLKMYRVWLQATFVKPLDANSNEKGEK